MWRPWCFVRLILLACVRLIESAVHMPTVFFHLSQNKLLLYDVCTAHWCSSEVSSTSCPQRKLRVPSSQPTCFISKNTEREFCEIWYGFYLTGSYRIHFWHVSLQKNLVLHKDQVRVHHFLKNKKDWYLTKRLFKFFNVCLKRFSMWFKFNEATLQKSTAVSMLYISLVNCIVISSGHLLTVYSYL
jgi:hypothetical protein